MLNTPSSMPSYVAREFTDRVVVTILIRKPASAGKKYKMFGILKYFNKEYIFSIYLSDRERDQIMCHCGARYYPELEGQQLSAKIRISARGWTYLKYVEPVGRATRRYKYYR